MKSAKFWMKPLVLFALLVGLGSEARADYTWVDGIKWTYTVSNGMASAGGGSSSYPAVPTSTSGAIVIPSTLATIP